MKKNQNPETETPTLEFFEEMLGLAKQAVDTQQQPNSICINRSRTINHINVEVHIENQPKPGLLRRLFSKLF
jgi:hypothetical protein